MPFSEQEFHQMQDLLDEKVRELHILYNVGTVIAGSLKISDLFASLWSFLKKELDLEAMTVTVPSEDENENIIKFTTLPIESRTVPAGGATGAVFESRRPEVAGFVWTV